MMMRLVFIVQNSWREGYLRRSDPTTSISHLAFNTPITLQLSSSLSQPTMHFVPHSTLLLLGTLCVLAVTLSLVPEADAQWSGWPMGNYGEGNSASGLFLLCSSVNCGRGKRSPSPRPRGRRSPKPRGRRSPEPRGRRSPRPAPRGRRSPHPRG